MANPFDQFDTPNKGAQDPVNSNPFDAFDTPHTAPQEAPQQPVYNNGTGVGGAFKGAVEGALGGLSSLYHGATELPGKVAGVASDIKNQYDTGTLFTPQFQQATSADKFKMLAGGAATGAAETGRAIAQLPNEVINTAGAISQSMGLGGSSDVDIYGNGELSQALTPHTEQGKTIAAITPYIVNPSNLAVEGSKVYAMSVKALQDKGIPLTAENIAQETAHNMTLLGAGTAAAPVAKFSGEIPGALRGKASLGTTAEALGAENAARFNQGGNAEAQQAYLNTISNDAGDIVAPSSSLYGGESAAGFKAAENRGGARYDARAEEAANPENIQRSVNTTAGENGANAQGAVSNAVDEFRAVKNQEYTDALHGAQDILDQNKVSSLKMNNTKEFAKKHLIEDADLESMPASTKKLLNKISNADFNDLHTVDFYKRKLSNEASKAARAGDYDTMATVNSVKTRMKTELDATLKHLSPDAAATYTKADRLFAEFVDPLGSKSKASKIANQGNEELAANQLVGNTATARGNVSDMAETLQKMQSNPSFENAGKLGQQFSEGLGNTARQRAADAAQRAFDTAEAANPGSGAKAYQRTFNRTLAGSGDQMESVAGLGNRSESAINNAFIDAVNTVQPSKFTPSGAVSNIAHFASHKIPLVGKLAVEPIAHAVGKGVDTIALRGMRDQAIRNTLASSSPEDLARIESMAQSGPVAAPNYTAGAIAGNQPTQQANPFDLAQPGNNGMVNITINPEPVQHAQSVQARPVQHAQSDEDKQVLKMYRALGGAETGHLKNRFIRTQAAESGVSTAYGPLQVTGTLAKDARTKYSHLYSENELKYLDRFIDQSEQMKHAPKGSEYDYGGAGHLGNTKEDRKMYADVFQKLLKQMYREKGSWSKVAHAWRGNDKDKSYFAKVAAHLKSQNS